MTRRFLFLAATAALLPGPAAAESFADALRAAIANNPTLAGARSRQQALAETPEQARAAGRLTAEVDGVGGYDRFGYRDGGGTGTASVNLPIFTGGRVRNAVRAATGDVAAGEQGVRDTAAQVLEQVAAAYAGVLFQQQAVTIAKADIDLLDSQVGEAKARFDLGTGTATDTARLVAQREGAEATLASAQASLAATAATYRAVVGHDPGALEPAPADLPRQPATLDTARTRSLAANPLYRQTLAAQGAATARIGVARSNGAPSVGVGAAYGYGFIGGRDPVGYPASTVAGLTLRVPVLTGGLIASQVREARANASAAGHDVEAAAREALRATDTAWANVAGARVRVEAGTRAVAAAERALAGVKAEYAVALRSTLDILIADESLRGAQLSLAGARYDLLVDEVALLRATGDLDTLPID